jgi:hypothetical protein
LLHGESSGYPKLSKTIQNISEETWNYFMVNYLLEVPWGIYSLSDLTTI